MCVNALQLNLYAMRISIFYKVRISILVVFCYTLINQYNGLFLWCISIFQKRNIYTSLSCWTQKNLKSHIFFKEKLKNVKEGLRQGFEFRNKTVGQCIGLLLRRRFCINSNDGFCITFSQMHPRVCKINFKPVNIS